MAAPCADPISYWLRGPAVPFGPSRSRRTPTADVVDHRRRLHRPVDGDRADRRRTPRCASSSSRQRRVAFGASGRNGGFCEASLTHGLANGIRHFPDELERLEAEGIANLRGLDRVHARARHRLRPRGDRRRSPLADQPYQADEFRAWRDEAAEHGEHARVPRPGRGPGRDPLAALAGRAATGRRAATSSSTRPSCAGASRGSRERRGVRIHEGTRGHAASSGVAGGVAASHGRRRAHPGRPASSSPRRPTRAGCAGWPPLFVPVYDYVLVSEPLTPGRARGDRLGAAPGPVRREQPVPLLPADRRRPDPVGRLRRDPLLRQPGRAGARPPAGDVRQARGPVLPGLPAARRAALPVPLGRRDRHDHAVHGHVRPDDGRPRDLRARLHRAGRGRQPLGGRRRARLPPAARRGPAAAADRPERRRSPSRPSRSGSLRRQPGPARARPRRPRRGSARSLLLRTLDALGIGFDTLGREPLDRAQTTGRRPRRLGGSDRGRQPVRAARGRASPAAASRGRGPRRGTPAGRSRPVARVELGAQPLDLALADLVGQRLARPADVAVGLDHRVGLGQAGARAGSRSTAGAASGARGCPVSTTSRAARQACASSIPKRSPSSRYRPISSARRSLYRPQPSTYAPPTIARAEPAERVERRVLLLERDLEVMARDGLVVRRRGQLGVRARLGRS